MAKKFLVMNIGCLECGVRSEVVGVYEIRMAAEATAAEQETWRDGGQSKPEVFVI